MQFICKHLYVPPIYIYIYIYIFLFLPPSTSVHFHCNNFLHLERYRLFICFLRPYSLYVSSEDCFFFQPHETDRKKMECYVNVYLF